MSRKLIFHFGGPKTGSSALQLFLKENSASLEKMGIFYLNAPATNNQVTSGNGSFLYQQLISECSDGCLETTICSYISERETSSSICSSEIFSFLNEQQLSRLFTFCKKFNFECQFIFFVRDPLHYVISNYNQGVKRHGLHQKLGAYLKNARWDHADSLRRLKKIIPNELLKVIHYDESAKKNIVKVFFGEIGINISGLDLEQTKIINPSLCGKELEIMIRLNEILGAAYSQKFSDILLSNATGTPSNGTESKLKITASEAAILKERFYEDIEWVNVNFFCNNKSGITVEDNYSATDENADEARNDLSVETKLLLCMATELAEARKSILQTTKNTIQEFLNDKSLAKHESIPSDFNPVLYCIINPDLIINQVNPYFHYVNYAKKEGRKYKF